MSALKNKHICLWSCPRNVSTALMYSFAQREDCRVFDEPLYGFYLANTDTKTKHPEAEKIISSMETNGEKVIDNMLKENSKPIMFFKHMTHHLLNLNLDFLSDTINVFLTRNPRNMIASFSKVIDNPKMADLGYVEQIQLIETLIKSNLPIFVLDSSDITKNPNKSLRLLCEKIDINFDKNMLSWSSGPIPEDGIWAKHWYKKVHSSMGFKKNQKTNVSLTDQNELLAKKCMPLYDKLMTYSILL